MAEVRFVKEIPPPGRHNPWMDRLRPLVTHPGRPAEIFIADSAENARDAVKNLNARKVIIPRPDHHWVFTARENVVFAIYKGKGGRTTNARVRRAK